MALEYIKYHDPSDDNYPGYSQEVEMAVNLLYKFAFDEPYGPSAPDELGEDLLYGVEDAGVLIAAAQVGYPALPANAQAVRPVHIDERFASLKLIGVAPERRGGNVGRGLLRRVEAEMRKLGAVAVIGFPMTNHTAQTPEGARLRKAYEHIGYPQYGHRLVIKYL